MVLRQRSSGLSLARFLVEALVEGQPLAFHFPVRNIPMRRHYRRRSTCTNLRTKRALLRLLLLLPLSALPLTVSVDTFPVPGQFLRIVEQPRAGVAKPKTNNGRAKQGFSYSLVCAP